MGRRKLIMNSQRFHVKIHLKLEAVTCPGVWICSHGYLEVTIKVLGYLFRTGTMEPFFPLLCHDHFIIEGYFKNAQSIGHLMKNFSIEQLEITLWQNSRRLAYYVGTLMDLLQCTEPKIQCPHKNTRQLLMKTTAAFPGIIAPKVEITSDFFIKDTFLNLCITSEDLRTCTNLQKAQVNAKLAEFIQPKEYQRPCDVQTDILEGSMNTQQGIRKQKTVCHTKEIRAATKKPLKESVYKKSIGRRVSLASSCCSSDNTHTSVGICNIEHDGYHKSFDDHNHDKFCELCRLYKEVFLQ